MEFLRALLRRRFARAQVATSRKVGCFLRLPTLPLGRDRASSKTSIENNLPQTPKQTALHADLGCPRLDEKCNNFCIKTLAKVSRGGPLSHHLAMTRAHVHEYQTRARFSKLPITYRARKPFMCTIFSNSYTIFIDFES